MNGPADIVARFFRALDERDTPTLVQLMAPGGVWHRQGAALSDAAAIEAAMAARSPTLRIVHLLTNLHAEPAGDEEAEVTGYMLVVRHDDGAERRGPAPLEAIENIRTLRARLRRTVEGWRIRRLANDAPGFARLAKEG